MKGFKTGGKRGQATSKGVRLLKQLMASHVKTEEEYEALLVTLPSHISNFTSLEKTPALTEDRLQFLKTKVRTLRYSFDVEALQRAWGPYSGVKYNSAIVADFVSKLNTLFVKIHQEHPLRIHAELAHNLRVNLADVVVVEDLLVRRFFGTPQMKQQFARFSSRMSRMSRMQSTVAETIVGSQSEETSANLELPFPKELLLVIFVLSAPFPTLNVLFHTQLDAQPCHGRPPTFGRQVFDAIGVPEWGSLINWVGCLSLMLTMPVWFPRLELPLVFEVPGSVPMKDESRVCFPFAVTVGEMWDPVAWEEEQEKKREAEKEEKLARAQQGKGGKGKKPAPKGKASGAKVRLALDPDKLDEGQQEGVVAVQPKRTEPPIVVNGVGVGRWAVRWPGVGTPVSPTSPSLQQHITQRATRYLACYDITALVAPKRAAQARQQGAMLGDANRDASICSLSFDVPARRSYIPTSPPVAAEDSKSAAAPSEAPSDAKKPITHLQKQDGPRALMFAPFTLFVRGIDERKAEEDALDQQHQQQQAHQMIKDQLRPPRGGGGLRKEGKPGALRARAMIAADASTPDAGGDSERAPPGSMLSYHGSLYGGETWDGAAARRESVESLSDVGSEGSAGDSAPNSPGTGILGDEWAGVSRGPQSEGSVAPSHVSAAKRTTHHTTKLHNRDLDPDEEDKMASFVAKVRRHAITAEEASARMRTRLYQRLREPFCCTRHMFEQLRFFSTNDRALVCDQCTREKYSNAAVVPLSQHCAMEAVRLTKKERQIRDMVEAAQNLAKGVPVHKDALHRHVDDEIDSLIAAINDRKKKLKFDIDERKRREQDEIEREIKLCEEERRKLDMAAQILDAMGRRSNAEDTGVERLFLSDEMAGVLRQEATYDEFWQLADVKLHRPMGISTGLELALPAQALQTSADRLDWSVPKKHLSRRIYPPEHVAVPALPTAIQVAVTVDPKQAEKAAQPVRPRHPDDDPLETPQDRLNRIVNCLESVRGIAHSKSWRRGLARVFGPHRQLVESFVALRLDGMPMFAFQEALSPEKRMRERRSRLASVTPETAAAETGKLRRDQPAPKQGRAAFEGLGALLLSELKRYGLASTMNGVADLQQELRQLPEADRRGMIVIDAIDAALSYDLFKVWVADFVPTYLPATMTVAASNELFPQAFAKDVERGPERAATAMGGLASGDHLAAGLLSSTR